MQRWVMARKVDTMRQNDFLPRKSPAPLAEAVREKMAKVAEKVETEVAEKGGEVSPQCPPADKDKAFWNGAWWAAHNIAAKIRDTDV